MSFRATVRFLKGMGCLFLLFLVAVFVGFDWRLLAIGLPMLGLAGLALTVHGYMTHQCTATVFRDPNGYVTRIVTEGQRVLYCTFLEHPAEVVDTGIKSTEDRYNGFRTKDNVPVDMRVKLYFRLDPTLIPEDELPQLVRLNEEAWKSLVRTVTRGTVLTFIGQQRYRHIAPAERRDALCAALSREAAQALQGLGVIMSPAFGVSIQDIQPTNAVLEAIVDRINAPLKGQAAVETLAPVADRYGEGRTLEAAIASAILSTGAVPSVIQEEVARGAIPAVRPRKPAA
ncbi:MAG: SPFH domain-containing protein [Anaerolineae bacterium]